ncbi:YlbE family protein [Nitrososphaera viennensis]|uniref:DUF1116 domain-containing protein n=2 Tax=Nitrososphaera viennensis TaxID=1034015 RepID=A0A060HKU8_9ARCH|nr:DUF1116 domain-containing protein [Nitrososphaera viennensis]AIC15850.1 hypothetical protein NVIE_015980 [Nitrososphaera viennensis EN76]UVS67839.1 DUF1116 domain-containing protein [Nitrososphaera viennensis]
MAEDIKVKIESANKDAIQKVLSSRPFLVDVRPAIEVLPDMKKRSIFHAGPPVDWKRMCGPMKGAVVATVIFEKWANSWDEAAKLVESGEVELSPNHDHDAVGPMAGVISPSMPVFVVRNEKHGNTNYGRIVENKVQFGAYDAQAIESLEFWSTVLAPAIRKALERIKRAGDKGIDLKSIMAKALYMGDELHNRPVAGTALFAVAIMPHMVETVEKEQLIKVIDYFAANEIFFLCLAMAACKATMNAASNIEHSTLVTAMARNGTDFGIKVSGLGNQWFTGPAGMIRGMYFPGFGDKDANPDMGDSAITETAGVGGFALADSPAILSLVGGTAEDALKYTKQMREITMASNDTFLVPIFDFQGTGTGIDIRKVVKTGILPVIDTAIAHREPGIGMIGAGLVNPPMEAFKGALREFARKYKL